MPPRAIHTLSVSAAEHRIPAGPP